MELESKPVYQRPKTKILPLPPIPMQYLVNERKIPETIIDEFRIGFSEYGEILIPFYDENNELCLIKKRHALGGMLKRKRRFDDGTTEEYECKTDCEPKGRPVLFGSHLAKPELGPLVICFGEYDAMSIAVDDVPNVVSPPYGDSSLLFIDEQFEWLEKFNEVIIYPDLDENDQARRIAKLKLQELAQRLGLHKCRVVREKDRLDFKDANQALIKKGRGFNRRLIENAELMPIAHVCRLADVTEQQIEEGPPLGWKSIDEKMGGAMGGAVTLIAGDNNAGKTTVALNIAARLVNQRIPVFYWSGEQKLQVIRWWYEQILAGPQWISSKVSEKNGREYHFADPRVVGFIRDWYRNYFYTIDKRNPDQEEFFNTLERAVRRYDIKAILIDNLMAFTDDEEQYLRAQSAFIRSCKNFAETWNRHVFVVVHNKKLETKDLGVVPGKDAIEGSKKITNWVDFVIQNLRITPNIKIPEYAHANSIMSLCKNRETGEFVDVRMVFDGLSKRIQQLSTGELLEEEFGWVEFMKEINQHQQEYNSEDF